MKRRSKRVVPLVLTVCLGISGVLPNAGGNQAKAASNLEDGLV